MTVEERIEKLKQARLLVDAARRDAGSPMIESALAEADMNLHWALWNLGEPVELRPELEAR
jgi:hypothetical protein